MVTKTADKKLSRIAIGFSKDDPIRYYVFYPAIPNGATDVELTDDNTYNTFRGSDVVDGEVYVEFFTGDKRLSKFLENHLSSIKLFEVRGAQNVVFKEDIEEDYNIFYKGINELQDYHLHWGQFAWNRSDEEPIDTSELHIATQQMARDFDDRTGYSKEEREPKLSDFDDFRNDQPGENPLNPMKQVFHMLIAKRGEEKEPLRSYIKDYGTQANPQNLDRWTAWNTHIAAYSQAGTVAPGKIGEEEIIDYGTPLSPGDFAAFGIEERSVSKSLALSEGAFVSVSSGDVDLSLIASHTINKQEKYNSENKSAFMDVNGDGYPDVLESKTDLQVRLTNPLGGHGGFTQYSTTNTISRSVNENIGGTMSGKYANMDPRFMSTEIKGDWGTSKNLIEWMDLNGDGLPDRIWNTSGMTVDLNSGKGLLVNKPFVEVQLPKSESFTAKHPESIFLENLTSFNANSFSGGAGMNLTGSKGKRLMIDLNGDGLIDKIELDNKDNLNVYINTGTSLDKYSVPSATGFENLSKTEALGIAGHLAGAYGVEVMIFYGVAHLKLTFSGNGQVNYALNELKQCFMDVNGDGVPDFVTTDDEGNIVVNFALIEKSNLLKKVTNPLKGSFTIDYERVGNKFGAYPVKVKTHTTKASEVMTWDMPESKWVMSKLITDDGFNPVNGSTDLDGEDQLEYNFAYDGGLKSRREREFLGFTRVETRHPANMAEPVVDGKDKEYITEVVQFSRAMDNEPQYRRRFEYLKGIATDHYRLHNRIEAKDVWEGETFIGTEVNHYIKLMEHKRNDYDFYKVIMDPESPDINKLAFSKDKESFEIVDWNNVSEGECIFPAIASTETFTIPLTEIQTGTNNFTDMSSKYHAVKYDLKYDRYLNVIEYSNEGVSSVQPLDSIVVDTVVNIHYDFMYITHRWSDFIHGSLDHSSSFSTGEVKCYIVRSPVEGFSSDTLCAPGYLSQQPCSKIPLPDPPLGDNPTVTSVHRKLVYDTIFIKDVDFQPVYSGRIVAKMEYFSPAGAAGQTNMLKRHKIYLGTVDANGLERHAEVYSLWNNKAPGRIYNWLDGAEKAQTDLTYDAKGNVLTIQGPPNDASIAQRLTTTYTYDGDVGQFVTGVTNSYRDQVCFKYDPATGNLLKMEGVNGHPTQYVYDNFYRLKEVWAPRELEQTHRAATISFEYHPFGIDEDGTMWEQVPVAFTNHGINGGEAGGVAPPDPEDPVEPEPLTVDCEQLIDVSSRPAMVNPLQTATFMDGLQRVVQVKKDVTKRVSGAWSNEEARHVSGITSYDSIGREVSTSLSVLEAATSGTLGVFNHNKAGTLASQSRYDYANRVRKQFMPHEAGTPTEVITSFNWNQTIGSEWNFFTEVMVNGQKTKTFTNSFGQTIATLQNGNQSLATKSTTLFNYDALNQLRSTTDPENITTSYEYDNFGRLTKETHPDRGISQYIYDLAGNLTEVVTPGDGSITMEYHYNRLMTKTMPVNSSVYDVAYTYGSLNDGKNGAGRVTQVVQGANFKTEAYKYDELGNVIFERKIFKVPQAGQRTFTSQYLYDSWGRIVVMTYPDGERVYYNYRQEGGELWRVHGVKSFPIQVYVNKILYDGYGNMAGIEYGNGAQTTFTYNASTRRMGALSLTANGQLLNKSFAYDLGGNVTQIQSTISAPSLGKAYAMAYEYDDLNRLKKATGVYNSNSTNNKYTYHLDMTYLLDGRIDTKTQVYKPQAGNPFPENTYDYKYNYVGGKHRLSNIADATGGAIQYYEYNLAGSVTGIHGPVDPATGNKVYQQKLAWNEDQNLMAVEDNGLHHYLYDHNGERIMKGSLYRTGIVLDGEGAGAQKSYVLDPYTVYVNPYYIATHYDEEVEASKHYYMGSQRVASALISYPFVLESESSSDPGGGLPDAGSASYGAIQNLEDIFSHFGKTEGVDYDITSLLVLPSIEEDHYDSENAFGYVADNLCEEDPRCLCEHSRYWAKTLYELDCDVTRVVYWYHPDYLGNTEYITDWNGDPYQFFWYSPWGESLEDHHKYDSYSSNYYDSPFRFNGKEYDVETGNYYYGARYYNPKTSVWLSVDPLASEFPYISPYAFVENNPINMIDPTGMAPGWWNSFQAAVSGTVKGWFKTSKSEGSQSSGQQDEGPYIMDLELETVEVTADRPSDWGGDHSGLIQSATDEQRESSPVMAFLLDLSAWGLNNAYPAGALDDAGVVAQDNTATTQDQVNAAINVIMAGAGGKGGKLSKVPKSKTVSNVGGKYTKTTEVRPGSGPGQSRAEYVRYKNSQGKVIRTHKDTYDRANRFQHRKPLRGGPEGRKP